MVLAKGWHPTDNFFNATMESLLPSTVRNSTNDEDAGVSFFGDDGDGRADADEDDDAAAARRHSALCAG